MRPRSKSWGRDDTLVDFLSGEYTTNGGSTWTPKWPSYDRLLSYDKGGLSGWDIDNYHAKKKRGDLLPMTPYEEFQISGSCSPGAYSYMTTGGVGFRASEYMLIPDTYWPLSVETARTFISQNDLAELVQAAAARIYSNGWDALTFIAELHKVAAMFRGAFRRIISLLLRGRLDKLWLESRYGWRILLYDMRDIQKALSNLDDKRKRYSERVGYSESDTSTTVDVFNITNSQDGESIKIQDSWTCSFRGSVVADIEPPKFAFNPVTTAWELLTFSFVIDWFIGIGTWLESLSFLTLATGHTAATGYLLEARRVCTYQAGTLNSSYSSGSWSFSSDSSVTLASRSPVSISRIPHMGMRLDLGKLVDLAALAKARR